MMFWAGNKPRWGMTRSELIAAVGVEHLRTTPRQLFKDAYTELIIPRVEIGRYDFEIQFQMSIAADRLQQVLIRHEGDLATEPRGAHSAALKVLTERFGRPQRVATSDEMLWPFKTTTIYLDMLYNQDVMAYVAIRFRPSGQDGAISSLSAF